MKPKILIVDDTPQNISVLRNLLKDDFIVKAAKKGEDALYLAENDPPDIIILDILMPGMNGFEVCKTLKQLPKTAHIPVIFLTSLSDEDDEGMGLSLGAVDYITKPFKPAVVKSRIQNHLDLKKHRDHLENLLLERTDEVIARLGIALEYRDEETGFHTKRIMEYSRVLATKYGLSQGEAEILVHASPMHDIGKIGIPDSILLKPSKLTDEEYKIIQTHTTIGAKILKGGNSALIRTAEKIAASHHEKWNGTGYPMGIKGENIPIEGRIVGLADVYDALRSKRVYKPSFSHLLSRDYIEKESGKHFDPKLVNIFLENDSEFNKISIKYDDASDSLKGGA